ncbi:MAG TPA: type II toxin-antitoxin system RelE/ParE family toxin [Phycisphaerales bacterium]|nr:type II toxin-antitoxin system RelE/ParE family toxin [Phycisphaerales bacterium]
MADVVLTPEAQEQLEALPLTIHARVVRVFERLEDWPTVSGAKPLRGELAGYYRVRTGDYRVLFTVEGAGRNALVTVVQIGKRDGFYD